MLPIYIRDDLNMPLGKQIAQATHACGSFILGCFDFENIKWKTTTAEELKTLIEQLKINLAHSEQELEKHHIIITDLGHTVFKGIPTKTVSLDLSNDIIQKYQFTENKHESSIPDVRMVMVVNKTYMRSIPKNVFITDAIKTFAGHIILTLENYQNGLLQEADINNLKNWVAGSFAKITLVTDTDGLQQAITSINTLSKNYLTDIKMIDNTIKYLVVSPQTKDWFNEITGSFKML